MKKSIKKLVSASLLACAMVVSLVGCGKSDNASSGSDTAATEKADSSSDSSENTESNEELKPFRIGVGGQDGSGVFEGAGLAVKNGYLEEELKEVGFEPEYVYFPGAGPEINEAFAAGEIDAAVLGDLPVFTAKSNGIDNKIIALANQKSQYGILVNSDEIKTAKDLEGKKVIVPQGTIIQFFWENYAQAAGIDTAKVEIINATADATSLLQTGDADAYVTTGYVASYLASSGLGTLLESDTDTSDIASTFVFEATSSILDENPDLGVAVNKALIRAQEATIADPDSLYEALASENVPAEVWKDYYSFDPTFANLSPEIPAETLEYYDTLAEWMVSHSIVTDKVDVATLVDDSYYQKAVDELAE